MSTFAIATLGCKVNQYETEQLIKDFLRQGFTLVDFYKRADTYIVNTCTVTSQADRKSRQLIKRARRKNPTGFVIATGCSVANPNSQLSHLKEIDLLISNEKKAELIPSIFSDNGGKERQEIRIGEISSKTSKTIGQLFHTRPLVKIQDGCNQFCSYCIVPYTRGPSRSRAKEKIIAEIKELLKGGAQEIVLTGVHLGIYNDNSTCFENLLREIIAIPKLKRVRLSSLEIKEITPSLISLISSSKKICPHLHIPLQSGNDEILQAMKRNYTASEYFEVVEELKQKIPDLALTTDVIVGFPGEEEKHFQETISLVRQIGFRKLHVFKFSPRQGTPAASFSYQVPAEVKKRRSEHLIKVGHFQMRNFLKSYLGCELEILVEKEQRKGWLTGLSDNYIRVNFRGPSSLIGKITRVKVTDLSALPELDKRYPSLEDKGSIARGG